jgi:hypothetical protein
VPGQGQQVLDLIDACAERTLVMVDDADARDDTAELLERLATPDRTVPVRVLLIARDGDKLRRETGSRLSDRAGRLLQDSASLALAALAGSDEERRQWFIEAVQAYGHSTYQPNSIPTMSADDSILKLHARALAVALGSERAERARTRRERWSDTLDGSTVWGPPGQFGPEATMEGATRYTAPMPPRPRLSPDNRPERTVAEAADELAYHESLWWIANHWVAPAPPATLERASIALALLGADDPVAVLRRLPEFVAIHDDDAAVPRLIARKILARYPAVRDKPRMGPDLVVGWLVVSHLRRDDDLANALLSSLNQHALNLLAHAHTDFPDAVDRFTATVTST